MNTPIYAIGYARISDPKQQKGNGLENQEVAIKDFVTRNGWVLYPKNNEVLKETYTGMVHKLRPVYQSIVQLIKANPKKIKFVVIKVIDRATRAGSREYLEMKEELAELGVELRDVGGVIQPTVNSLGHRGVSYSWSIGSPSKLAEIIEAEKGSSERINILTRTVDSSIDRVQSGYKLRAPNDGYTNKKIVTPDGQERYIQVSDPERAGFFLEFFKLSAEGVYSDIEITEHINKLGYKTKIFKKRGADKTIIGFAGGQPMTVKRLQNLRKNPIYCGVNIENWGNAEKIRIISVTQYEGLVTIDLFNRANKGKVFIEELPDGKVKVLYNRSPEKLINKRNKFRKDYIFKNVILCPICNKPLKASGSAGKSGDKFPAYHCDRGHKRYGVARAVFEQEVIKYLNKIKFLDKYKKIFEQVAVLKYREEQKKNTGLQISVNEKTLEIQKKMQDTLETLKVTKSPKVRADFESQYEILCGELDNVRSERNKLEVTENELYDYIASTKSLMEHPAEMLANPANLQEQLALYKMFFEVLPTYSEIVSGTPKLGLAFRLTEANQDEKSVFVTLQRIELWF